MLVVKAQFFSSFRELVGGKHSVELDIHHAVKLREVIQEVDRLFPGFAGALLDQSGAIQARVSVLVNGRNVVFLDGLDTLVPPDGVVSFIPPSAGG
ncbi:MAG: MoaD family protein [Bacillota bacterium]